jgi:hypothetical protein
VDGVFRNLYIGRWSCEDVQVTRYKSFFSSPWSGGGKEGETTQAPEAAAVAAY